MTSFAELDQERNGDYLNLLTAVSKLSGLFSESVVPFINYRVIENIFCKSFQAENLSRSDTAFDAKLDSLGVGIKTFVSNSNNSTEKIAEFNSLSRDLSKFSGKELALKLGEFRNERINLAKRVYNIESSLYHIIVRKAKELLLFETDYNIIDITNINSIKDSKASLQFSDGKNFYTYNYSKSTLFRNFQIPPTAFSLHVDIIQDPYSLLLQILNEFKGIHVSNNRLVKGENFIVLPLYGIKNNEKFIFQHSGLNQWNANGRKRNIGEVYIPIPISIHKNYPNFFPSRDFPFDLQIPTGEVFSAKVCQANSKALMTNPNKALSDWLLRKILQLKEGELATMEKLDALGFDSVLIHKINDGKYTIDIMKTNSYSDFDSENY
ncbi:MAG: restriction endonuclease [Candidatus Kapabacteria bacterium]|nr:restriction endonuclease [Candidatus Kapabacteria bacterium]